MKPMPALEDFLFRATVIDTKLKVDILTAFRPPVVNAVAQALAQAKMQDGVQVNVTCNSVDELDEFLDKIEYAIDDSKIGKARQIDEHLQKLNGAGIGATGRLLKEGLVVELYNGSAICVTLDPKCFGGLEPRAKEKHDQA